MLSIRQTSFTFAELLPLPKLLLLPILLLQLLVSADRTTIFAAPAPPPEVDLNVMGAESVLTLPGGDVPLSPDDVINWRPSSRKEGEEKEERFFLLLDVFGGGLGVSNRNSGELEEDNKIDGSEWDQLRRTNDEDFPGAVDEEAAAAEEAEEEFAKKTLLSEIGNKWKRHLIAGPTFERNCPPGQRWNRNVCRDVLLQED